MGYKQKGHYGQYSGNAHHSKHHMVNSWEEEDVKRAHKLESEGHKGHAEALYDDAHDSYNWHPGMHTKPEHNEDHGNSPAKFGFFGNIASIVRGKRGTRRDNRRHDEVMDMLESIDQKLDGNSSSAGANPALAESTEGVNDGSVIDPTDPSAIVDTENDGADLDVNTAL